MKKKFARGAQTRMRIIQVASDLFHKQGIRATSPDAIIEASGTGKGQFYHYFKNKEGLVHAVLQTHLEAIKAGTAPVPYAVKSWRDLERWFITHIELQKQFDMMRGCPFGTVANELTEDDELIRQDLVLIFEIIKNKLAAFFLREKAQGRLAKNADENQLADFCIASIQGAMLMGKVQQSPETAEKAVQETLAHLKRYIRK
jgi:TetR/AcrR family transcriptional repressor of nem operon